MIRRITTILLFALSSGSLFSQTIRTDVLVIGGTAAGVSAGIQAARSGVKTMLITQDEKLAPRFSEGDLTVLERIRNYKKKSDAANRVVQSVSANPDSGILLVKSITDTLKNLSIRTGIAIRKIEKNGKGWEVKFQDGKSLKADAIIDATENASVLAVLNLPSSRPVIDINNYLSSAASFPKAFRSSVAYGKYMAAPEQCSSFLLPLASLLPQGTENLFVIPGADKKAEIESMSAGQAAGAAAAYCSFFKTSTKNLNVRVIQGELLAFEAPLVPFRDVTVKDRHLRSFQHMALTGLLKPQNDSVFDTSGTVSSEEIRQPMREFYSRSQIWFADKKSAQLSIEEVINLMMFTASRGEELRSEIEKGWKNSLKLSTAYDPKRAINRREFAVLADAYLQPFNRKIDLSGNLLN